MHDQEGIRSARAGDKLAGRKDTTGSTKPVALAESKIRSYGFPF